jgi:hypothetical protein
VFASSANASDFDARSGARIVEPPGGATTAGVASWSSDCKLDGRSVALLGSGIVKRISNKE